MRSKHLKAWNKIKTKNLTLFTVSVPLVVQQYNFGELSCKKMQSFSFDIIKPPTTVGGFCVLILNLF